jgi:hypothetical protein
MTNPIPVPSISLDDLARATGGRNPAGGLPMQVMSVPKPHGYTAVRDALGMGRAGSPGDTYRPATSNPDGSINQGGFSTPMSGPPVPQSR